MEAATTQTPTATTGTAATTGAPATGTPAATGPVSVPANAPSDWIASLPDAQKSYVQNKGFKDPAQVLDSYKNLETLMGTPKERLLRLPEKADAPEWGEIYERLGRPKEASEYKFDAPQGGEVNKEFAGWAQQQFHKLGLSRTQGETLAKGWNEYAMGEVKKMEDQRISQVKTEETALKRELGAAYDQEIQKAFKAAQTFGLGEAEVKKLESALGYSATMKFLMSVGGKVGEDSFVTGGNQGFKGALTPDMARAEIELLKQDTDWSRRYLTGDSKAKAEMERLMRYAHPDLQD